jgi:endoglucanase Acf2
MTDLSQLDDATAQRILTTIARARSSNPPDDPPHLRTALANEFGIVPSHTRVSPGDLARQALILLAEDPATRLAIDSMANEESTTRQTYDGGATIALGLAVYFALSTALDIERDKQGKWSFKMKLKPASHEAVKQLVEKLINYLPG